MVPAEVAACNSSRVSALTATGRDGSASFSTISAQSAGERSSDHLSCWIGTKSGATISLSATDEAAGVPLFMPARKRMLPGLTGATPLNTQCAAVSTTRGATSVPVHQPPVVYCPPVTTTSDGAGQGVGFSPAPIYRASPSNCPGRGLGKPASGDSNLGF